MAFTVVYDACVLFPAPLRDLLIRIGHAGLVRARWTGQILDEVFRTIRLRRPELNQPSPLLSHLTVPHVQDLAKPRAPELPVSAKL